MIESSGYHHGIPDPDVLDVHDYDQNPASFRADRATKDCPSPSLSANTAASAGTSARGWGYGNTPKDIEAFYARFQGLTDALLDNRRVCGYSYTQLTDVEQERNGLYTYDRKPKFDVARLRKIQSRTAAYETDPPKN